MGAALALPFADTDAMQRHIDEIALHVARGAHAVLLLDRAGWHTTGAAIEGADALAIVTEWKTFRTPDFGALVRALSKKVIFDGRNLFDPQLVEDAGLAYFPIGRGR